jgi:hypothetical protein
MPNGSVAGAPHPLILDIILGNSRKRNGIVGILGVAMVAAEWIWITNPI